MIKIYSYGAVANDEIFARSNPTADVSGIVADIIENVKNVDNNGTVDAYVELVEMTGSDCFVYGKIGKNNITSKTSNEIKIKSNQMCYMRINTNKIHVFDKINENLICD